MESGEVPASTRHPAGHADATAGPVRTYRRVVAARVGGPEVLELIEERVPEPLIGEVRVRVEAAGVGFPDLLMREGTYPGGPRPPFTPGCDVVGVVDAVGPGVAGVRRGDRVAALTYHPPVFGGYAEVVCLPAESVVAVPAGLDPAAVVSLVLNYVTAYQLLRRRARVRRGERLLVHGAAGGVGTAAMQLGRLFGLERYGTCSAAGARVVADLGGTPIDFRTEDFVRRLRALPGGGVDVVLDGIGGPVSVRSYRVLRRGGRLVLFGHRSTLVDGRRSARRLAAFYAGGATAVLANLLPGGRRVLTYRIAILRDRHPDWFRADLGVLLDLLAQGEIAPLIAERIPLAEARRAHERLGEGGVTGKLILIP
ncbi:MAG: zinc-binding dehydrogenase [Thermoleophilia bacterium]|nr:zinc-binding dehydrogenase [Thermoleophilia bacterium]